MKHRIVRAAAFAAAFAICLRVNICAQVTTSAKSSILLDAQTGRILHAKNEQAQSLIASTTKIMTGLLVCELCDLNEVVSISKEAVGVEGTSLYLKENERLQVKTLLYGMMLHSGNDAACALAVHVDGSCEKFAARMNARAKELGLAQTSFANPSGLDAPEHHSTAYDLAMLARAAMENETFRSVVCTKQITLEGRTFTNHNKLLWRYEGCCGVKTGYTRAAGRVLVSAAERGGRRLIAVTISDRNDWADHEALYEYGFSQFENRKLLQAEEIVCTVPVFGGVDDEAELVAGADLSWAVREGEEVSLRLEAPQYFFAPVLTGEVGSACLLVDGTEVARVPLYVASAVDAQPPRSLIERIFGG